MLVKKSGTILLNLDTQKINENDIENTVWINIDAVENTLW